MLGQITAGEAFGELALMNDKPRKCSVYALTPCFFAMLTETVYERLLKREDTKILQWKLKVLSRIPVFADLSPKELRGMVHFTKERRYVPGNILLDSRTAKDGDIDPWLQRVHASAGDMKMQVREVSFGCAP